MVLFDLNNVRGDARAVAGHPGHSRAFQADVLAQGKTVKRLSAHPWPFSVKNGVSRQTLEAVGPSRLASSFVT